MTRLRHAARALVLTPEDRVLLVEHHVDDRTVWAAPGGGLEPGEDVRAALRRELVEEIGLTVDIDGLPHVWHQTIVAEWAATGFDGLVNDYFVVRVPAEFVPHGALSDEALLQENVHGFRWFSAAEITATARADTRVVFQPAGLGALLPTALHPEAGPPAEIGV